MTASELAREALNQSNRTNAYRLIHGAPDGWPEGCVDRFGPFLLAMSGEPLIGHRKEWLIQLARSHAIEGIYFKPLQKQLRRASPVQVGPELIWGAAAPDPFEGLENGVRYGIRFREGYSCGLFLDQRENRRRLLERAWPSQGEGTRMALNLFAYTCAFSVCAALSGMQVTSVDLSKKYLEWGRENFRRNGLDPELHSFLYGDAFSWLRRLAKQEHRFDFIVLDPPTFSKSKDKKTRLFKVDRDLGALVEATLPLLKPKGELLVCTNMAIWPQSKFLQQVDASIHRSSRRIVQREFYGLPPDFPLNPGEASYLKTCWITVG